MEQQELDLREVFLIIRRRLWLLVALPVVAGVVAGLVSAFVLSPVYSASTTLWVIKDGTGQIQYNDLLLNRNLTKTYAEVAKSRAVMSDVISSLNLTGVKIADLQAKLTVTPVRDTEILEFAVQDENPVMAARIADAVAVSFKEQIRSYMKVENVVVVDQAAAPTSPIKPRKLMNVAVAMVLGFMAAAGLAFLLEYLDTSIKTPEDVTRHVGLPVLGIIPVIEAAETAPPANRPRRRNQSGRTEVGA
ncbi:MAG TPA: Wzz/FepE/Etk N-terminal domain-containing protein [Symbiobacteriaceae bacterium]|jgi:capsular polysaccharide biosynthesis protein|nr:Wzz/FepE/Etk N-terminal domain-containing protein [Symbiobacteriaceae bacterium]